MNKNTRCQSNKAKSLHLTNMAKRKKLLAHLLKIQRVSDAPVFRHDTQQQGGAQDLRLQGALMKRTQGHHSQHLILLTFQEFQRLKVGSLHIDSEIPKIPRGLKPTGD